MPSEGVPKCQRCRRDHKKCSPENRPWPGPKCDRCENYGYECSENMMARRSSQKDVDPTRAASRLIESVPHGKFYYQPTVAQALAVRPPTQTSAPPAGPPYPPSPWAGLFEYLRNVNWVNVRCLRGYSDPFAALMRSPTCPVPDISDLFLGRRQMCLELFLQHQSLVQNAAMPSTTAMEPSIHFFVTQLQRQHPRIAMSYGYEELSAICANHIRYGSYWNCLRSALQTDEILLIDPNYSFDADFPKITFESARQIWLSQDLGLRQFCQKLSGLSQMISDLARTEIHSEERAFLAVKIPDRLEEVLGPRPSSFTEAGRICTPPLFPVDILASSPMEMADADVYSPTDSGGAEGSDDGYSMGDGPYQAILGNNNYFSGHDIWAQ